MPREAVRRAAAVILGAGLMLGGCTASFQPMGASITQPRLAGNAIITADGFELPLRSWLPADSRVQALVVALHGYNDYSNAFEGPPRRRWAPTWARRWRSCAPATPACPSICWARAWGVRWC